MSHTIKDKKKLLNRIRRIQGQVDAVERALEQEQDPSTVLQTISACRGAINGLMAQVIEGHIHHHVIDSSQRPSSEQAKAIRELINVVRSYLK